MEGEGGSGLLIFATTRNRKKKKQKGYLNDPRVEGIKGREKRKTDVRIQRESGFNIITWLLLYVR
jgi:hypothetical protein